MCVCVCVCVCVDSTAWELISKIQRGRLKDIQKGKDRREKILDNDPTPNCNTPYLFSIMEPMHTYECANGTNSSGISLADTTLDRGISGKCRNAETWYVLNNTFVKSGGHS